MSDLKTELVLKLSEYELQRLLLKKEFLKTHPEGYEERELRNFINRRLRTKTKELILLNIQPSMDLMKEHITCLAFSSRIFFISGYINV